MSSFKERIHAIQAEMREEEERKWQERYGKGGLLIIHCLQPLIRVIKGSPIEEVLGEMKEKLSIYNFKFWFVAAINCDEYRGKQSWPQFVLPFVAARRVFLTAYVDSVKQLDYTAFKVSEYLTSSGHVDDRPFLPSPEDKYVLSNPKIGYVAAWKGSGEDYTHGAAFFMLKGNGIIVKGEKNRTLSTIDLEDYAHPREALEEAALNALRHPERSLYDVTYDPAHRIPWDGTGHIDNERFSSL